VVGAITHNYVDVVQTSSLVRACRTKLPGFSDLTAARTEGTDDVSLDEVAAILAKLAPEEASAAAESCMQSMVESLDAQSKYLDAEEWRLMQDSRAIGSIGLAIASAPGGARITGTIYGSPAASADIVPGDVLTAIDDVDLTGRTLSEILRLLRGSPGSRVTITVLRGPNLTSTRLTLIRQVVHQKPFDGHLLEPGLVYLGIQTLSDRTTTEMAEVVARVRRENNGAFRGVVLDLRGCPGGVLNDAVAVSAAFLPAGTLVTESRGRDLSANRRFSAVPADYWKDPGADPLANLPLELKSAPVAVLIDRRTASGCEIVASALHDQKRAVVIGQHSFGNGSIQSIILMTRRPDIKRAAIKLTTARIYRPNGEPLDQNGVEPDVVVPMPDDSASPAKASPPFGSSADPIAGRAVEILKSGWSGGR